jgi:hypothetical protein
MARSRTIKPSFFTNEELAELPRDVRLFFVGLWPIADREGRIENRPKRIKRDVFPYDVDVTEQLIESWLSILEKHPGRFVELYQVDGGNYIQIKNFKKHQDIHPREAKSELPGPKKADPVQPKADLGSPCTGPDGNQTGTSREIIPLPSLPSLPSASLSAHVLEASDPDPARARVERSPGCKCQGDICLTPSLCEQATVEAIAKATKERFAKRPTGHDLVTMFGFVRLEVFPNTLPWNTARDTKGDAGSFAVLLSESDLADVEPSMRLALEHIRDGVKGWHDPRLAKDPSFSFGAWKSGFHALREEMHRKAPPAPGSLEARKPARPVVKPYERMGDYAKEAASDGASASVADPDSLIRDLVHHVTPPSDRERSTS